MRRVLPCDEYDDGYPGVDDRICSAIPVVALWRARRCGYLWLGILPGWSAYRLPRIWLPSSPDTLRLYAASRDLVITREAAQPSYGCTAITSSAEPSTMAELPAGRRE